MGATNCLVAWSDDDGGEHSCVRVNTDHSSDHVCGCGSIIARTRSRQIQYDDGEWSRTYVEEPMDSETE